LDDLSSHLALVLTQGLKEKGAGIKAIRPKNQDSDACLTFNFSLTGENTRCAASHYLIRLGHKAQRRGEVLPIGEMINCKERQGEIGLVDAGPSHGLTGGFFNGSTGSTGRGLTHADLKHEVTLSEEVLFVNGNSLMVNRYSLIVNSKPHGSPREAILRPWAIGQ
jgi:hypothetical protein